VPAMRQAAATRVPDKSKTGFHRFRDFNKIITMTVVTVDL
jgi:hypothetical protein